MIKKYEFEIARIMSQIDDIRYGHENSAEWHNQKAGELEKEIKRLLIKIEKGAEGDVEYLEKLLS